MKKALLVIAMIVLTSCSTTIGNEKLADSRIRIENQMDGVSSKTDAREKFGTPNLVFQKNNLEYYEYRKIYGAGRYHWLIPLIGWVMSWFQDNYTFEETNLFIGFDKSGKVVDYDIIQSGGTM